jgi:sigma-B regulation protein RsbU (phosphoserine phosphatase)
MTAIRNSASRTVSSQEAGEQLRLAAVRRYRLEDSSSDGAFDEIASPAARTFDVPMASVTIVDDDRVCFRAAHGFRAVQTGREPGPCASAIAHDGP